MTAPSPAPRPAEPRAQALPAQPGPLLGRAGELAALGALLAQPDARLVTLTGPGGVGKTRLALAAAEARGGDFPAGVAFVALAPLADPDLVLPTIARVLGLRERPGTALAERLAEYLVDQQMLLVLDNVEHLLPAAPGLADLLAACPGPTLLVTSRAELRLRWERVFPVPPLALPAPGASPSPDELASYAAVRLFVERARAARPGFALTDDNAAAVAAICRRLDGLPLALELAAARLRALSPEALLARLNSSLALLTDGARDLPARQRTLRDTLAWSHDLLGAGEQRLFARLAVFAGDWTAVAAEVICDADGAPHMSVLDGLDALARNNMIQQGVGADGEPRFAMLETVREYALERLAASGEGDSIRRRHASYYLTLMERVAPPEPPPGDVRVAWVEADYGNLLAALRWALARGERPLAVPLLDAAHRLRGWFRPYRSASPHQPGPPLGTGDVLLGRYRLDRRLGHGDIAVVYLATDLHLGRQVVVAVLDPGLVAAAPEGDFLAQFDREMRVVTALDHPHILPVYDHGAVGAAPYLIAPYVDGGTLRDRLRAEGSFSPARAARYLRQVAAALDCAHGGYHVVHGDVKPANMVLRAHDDHLFLAEFGFAGVLSATAPAGDRAGAFGTPAYMAPEQFHHRLTPPSDVYSLGCTLFELLTGEPPYPGPAGQAIYGHLHDPIPSVAERSGGRVPVRLQPVLDRALAKQPEERFQTAGELARAFAAAIGAPGETEGPRAGARPGGLSGREIEVLRLVAEGLTDAQAAERLFLSPHTVGAHLRAIYGKLGVDNRTAAARAAAERQLL
ncbi:MAG TPA: protein kinase [Thermomicrobiales bacterium]|nr:protein kinase [Thermomicrobiales bacterium]